MMHLDLSNQKLIKLQVKRKINNLNKLWKFIFKKIIFNKYNNKIYHNNNLNNQSYINFKILMHNNNNNKQLNNNQWI